MQLTCGGARPNRRFFNDSTSVPLNCLSVVVREGNELVIFDLESSGVGAYEKVAVNEKEYILCSSKTENHLLRFFTVTTCQNEKIRICIEMQSVDRELIIQPIKFLNFKNYSKMYFS